MKIVNVITPHFTPEITAAAHRIDAIVSTLSAEYKVNVFTLTERGKKAHEKEMQVADNVTVHSTNLPLYPKSLFFIRALYELYYSIVLCRKAAASAADLTLITTPYMFLLPVATLFGAKGKKIADVRDLVWCYLPDRNGIQSFIRKQFQKLACRFIAKYDHVTVTNQAEMDWILTNTGLDHTRISILSNGISAERFEKLTSLKYHGGNSPFVITYVGNVGNGQDLYPLVDCVKNMPDVKLNIIGDGIEIKKLHQLVRNQGISNVHLHGKLKWSRVLPFYQSSSVLFARLGVNYRSAIPSKLFEYLSTGLPVLFHGSGEAKNFLLQFDNTYIVEEEDSASLGMLLTALRNRDTLRSGKNRRLIEQYFIREHINDSLIPVIDKLLGQAAAAEISDEKLSLVLREDVI